MAIGSPSFRMSKASSIIDSPGLLVREAVEARVSPSSTMIVENSGVVSVGWSCWFCRSFGFISHVFHFVYYILKFNY
jgi:hypothetical protein